MGYFHQKRDKMREKKLKALKWDSYEEITQGFKLMLKPLKVKMNGSGHVLVIST